MEKNEILAIEMSIDRRGEFYLNYIQSLKLLKQTDEKYDSKSKKSEMYYDLPLPMSSEDYLGYGQQEHHADISEYRYVIDNFDLMLAGLDSEKYTKESLVTKIVSQLKKEFTYFKNDNLAFLDGVSLATFLSTQSNKEDFERNTEKLGFVILVVFEQPIEAIRVLLKDLELRVPLNNGEEGHPVCIPSQKLQRQIQTS